jgi:hypothetical protein
MIMVIESCIKKEVVFTKYNDKDTKGFIIKNNAHEDVLFYARYNFKEKLLFVHLKANLEDNLPVGFTFENGRIIKIYNCDVDYETNEIYIKSTMEIKNGKYIKND